MTFQELMTEAGTKQIDDYTSYTTWICARKLKFFSFAEALNHRRYLKGNFNVYECAICGYWHLTGEK